MATPKDTRLELGLPPHPQASLASLARQACTTITSTASPTKTQKEAVGLVSETDCAVEKMTGTPLFAQHATFDFRWQRYID